mmetsp:Transcript_40472/g.104736  ORF Transcript_40472/g.104736 Transcript_40472/m.104736 type:complete len:423 (+) Transcript_40472:196-1464(+)
MVVVEDVCPNHHLRILVQEGTCGLHGKGLHARPRDAGVTDLLAGQALRVDQDHALRGEEHHVAGALERHLAGLAALQNLGVLVEPAVLLDGVQHAHVAAEPRPPAAALVLLPGVGVGLNRGGRGVLAQDPVGEIPLDRHDVCGGVVQLQLELVLLRVADGRPERELAVAVQEGPRGRDRKGLDGAPEVAPVVHLLAGQTLHVDVQHPPGGHGRCVPAAPEGHVYGLVRQQDRWVHLQLRFHHLRVDGPRVAHEEVHEFRRRSVVHPLRLRCHLGRRGPRVEDLLVDEALQREDVDVAALPEGHGDTLGRHPGHLLKDPVGEPRGPDRQLHVQVQRPGRLDGERLDGAVGDALPGDAGAREALLVLDQDAVGREVDLVARPGEGELERFAIDENFRGLLAHLLAGRLRVDRGRGAAAPHGAGS